MRDCLPPSTPNTVPPRAVKVYIYVGVHQNWTEVDNMVVYSRTLDFYFTAKL